MEFFSVRFSSMFFFFLGVFGWCFWVVFLSSFCFVLVFAVGCILRFPTGTNSGRNLTLNADEEEIITSFQPQHRTVTRSREMHTGDARHAPPRPRRHRGHVTRPHLLPTTRHAQTPTGHGVVSARPTAFVSSFLGQEIYLTLASRQIRLHEISSVSLMAQGFTTGTTRDEHNRVS